MSGFFTQLILVYPPKQSTLSFSVKGFVTKTYWSFFKNLLSINFVALFLGGWWAFQEGSWGGWWNWDISEVFGLYIALQVLWLAHTAPHALNVGSGVRQIMFSGLLLFIFYFFMQLNFNLISHNFGLRSTYFFVDFNYIIWLIVVSGVVGYVSFTKPRSQTGLVSMYTVTQTSHLNPIYFLHLYALSLLLVFSLVILFNNFSFLYLGLNFGNWLPGFQILTYYATLVLYLTLGVWTTPLLFILGGLAYLCFPASLIFVVKGVVVRTGDRFLKLVHIFIFSLFFTTYNLGYKILSSWAIARWGLSTSPMHVTITNLENLYIPTFQLNTPLIEAQLNHLGFISYDYAYLSSSLNNKIFNLPLTSYSGIQEFLPCDYLPSFTSQSCDPLIFLIAMSTLFVWLSLLFFLRSNYALEK